MSRPIVIPLVVNASEVAIRAKQSLGLSDRELAQVAECSLRTVSRWWGDESTPRHTHFQALAAFAFPKDAALAADLATAGGVTLEQLGLRSPAPPPQAPKAAPPPELPPVATRLLAESVVCSAAEELDAPPRAVRGVLRAAFRRAREMRLSVEEMDDALSAAAAPAAPKGSKQPKPAS
jgi:transcriptional regulator with XRE-family HTH domain